MRRSWTKKEMLDDYGESNSMRWIRLLRMWWLWRRLLRDKKYGNLDDYYDTFQWDENDVWDGEKKKKSLMVTMMMAMRFQTKKKTEMKIAKEKKPEELKTFHLMWHRVCRARDAATAAYPWTTACSPVRITLPGALASTSMTAKEKKEKTRALWGGTTEDRRKKRNLRWSVLSAFCSWKHRERKFGSK